VWAEDVPTVQAKDLRIAYGFADVLPPALVPASIAPAPAKKRGAAVAAAPVPD